MTSGFTRIRTLIYLATISASQVVLAFQPVLLNGTAVCGVGAALPAPLDAEGAAAHGARACVPGSVRCAWTCGQLGGAFNCSCFNYYTNGSCVFFSAAANVGVTTQLGCTLWAVRLNAKFRLTQFPVFF